VRLQNQTRPPNRTMINGKATPNLRKNGADGCQPRRRTKRGTLALETALAMPVILLLTAQMISLIWLARLEIRLQGALDRTAAELSLLSPLCRYLESAPTENPADRTARQMSAGDQPQSDRSRGTSPILAALRSFWPDLDLQPLLEDAMLDLASSELLGRFIQYRFSFWLQDAGLEREDRDSAVLNRRLYLDWQLDRRILWLCVSYQVRTPLSLARCQTTAAVPLWIGAPAQQTGNNAGQIWQMDNFSRGLALRERFGGNLPYDFPVIAAWSGGEALMIKSADLTAPTYQDEEAVQELVQEQITRLAGFSGADYRRDGKRRLVTPQMITSRRLLLIIPDNCSQPWLDGLLTDLRARAADHSVVLEVVRFGRSDRFQDGQEQLVS
jgi:hypothetical protein